MAHGIVTVRVHTAGETRVALGSALDGASVVLQAHETAVPDAKAGHRTTPCTGSRIPCLLTDSLEIAVNGKALRVPYSVFSDLGDMSSLSLARSGEVYTLTIYGGDASESYIVKLRFDRTRVMEREFFYGEDSSHVVERSTYFAESNSLQK